MASLTPTPKFQFINAAGEPLFLGKLYSYAAGTDTPLVTYQNSGGVTQNTNPVILDAYGSANVWLGSALYKLVLKDSLDSTIWTVDNVGGGVTLADLAGTGTGQGANLIGFIQSGVGAIARTAMAKMREELTSQDITGIDPLGLTDSTDGFESLFTNAAASGRPARIMKGDYLIAGAGPNAGGVLVTIADTLEIICDPGVYFFTDSLDGDFFGFNMDSDGPTDGRLIQFIWKGGAFNRENQKVSTSVPSIGTYPPPVGLVGTSGTCEAITVRMAYDPGSGNICGASLIHISDVDDYCGEHWEVAGGDTCVFASGGREILIERIRGQGNRDLCVYLSPGGTDQQIATVRDCLVINSYYGISFKRSVMGIGAYGNQFENCVGCILTSRITGDGTRGGAIYGNSATGCNQIVRLQYTFGVHVFGNTSTDMGALDVNGDMVTTQPIETYHTEGCTRCYFIGNNNTGMSGEYTAGDLIGTASFTSGDTGTVQTTSCIFKDIVSLSGLTDCGTDAAGSVNNYFENVVAIGGANPNPIPAGGTAYVVRGLSNGQRIYRNPLLFGNGSVTEPIIARETQVDTGVYFDTNEIGVSVAAVQRLGFTLTRAYLSNTNLPTFADNAAAGAGGLTDGQLYKTSAGTIQVKLP